MGMPGDSDEIVVLKSQQVIVEAYSSGVIHLEVKVKEGFHIQAHELKDDLLVPTTLEIRQDENFIIEAPVFPPSKKFRLEGTDSELDVYDGQFEILSPFRAKRKGKYRLGGTLKYQACDSARCLFPRSIDFVVDVYVK